MIYRAACLEIDCNMLMAWFYSLYVLHEIRQSLILKYAKLLTISDPWTLLLVITMKFSLFYRHRKNENSFNLLNI